MIEKNYENAHEWVMADAVRADHLDLEVYCGTRDVFDARLARMISELSRSGNFVDHLVFQLTAIAGEIGNNSFDHNIGRWPDIPGVLFCYEFSDSAIAVVLADRGQGVLATLKNVKPELPNDVVALNVAF
ncbi:MAG TPA: hypothetical protein VJJ24_01000 [Candidatus Paceibacterota bacterium]